MSLVFFRVNESQLKSLMLISEDLVITDLCVKLLKNRDFNNFSKEFKKINNGVFTEVTLKKDKGEKMDFDWIFSHDVRIKSGSLSFGIDVVKEKGEKYFSISIDSIRPDLSKTLELDTISLLAILGVAVSIGLKGNLLIGMEEFKSPANAMKVFVASVEQSNEQCQYLLKNCRKGDEVARKGQVVTYRPAKLPYL